MPAAPVDGTPARASRLRGDARGQDLLGFMGPMGLYGVWGLGFRV